MTREKRLDRFGKWIGLSREIQTGDSQFDDDFYISTDTVSFARSFFDSVDRRHAIQKLFAFGYTYIELGGGRLRAVQEYTWKKPDQENLNMQVRELASLEKGVTDLAVPTGPGAPRSEIRAVLFAIPSIALAGSFAFGCQQQVANPDSLYVLDLNALNIDSLRYSFPVFLAYLLLSVLLMRGSSSAHRDLLIIVLLSGSGFSLSAREAESHLNMARDEGTATAHVALLISKEPRDTGDDKVRVDSWRPGHSIETLRVREDVYDRVIPGRDSFTVVTKPGRFGFEWVVSVKRN